MKDDSHEFNASRFSVADIGWVDFKPEYLSFALKGLPDAIHYTIAWNANSPNINLHLSKNISTKGEKPRIYIVVVEKQLAERLFHLITHELIKQFLTPISLRRFHKKALYIPGSKLEAGQFPLFLEGKFAQNFGELIKLERNGKKVKVLKGIDERLERTFNSDETFTAMAKEIRVLRTHRINHLDFGVVIFNGGNITVVKVGKRFYSINPNVDFDKVMSDLVGPNLITQIKTYIRKSIVRLRKAKSAEDVAPFNCPLELPPKKK